MSDIKQEEESMLTLMKSQSEDLSIKTACGYEMKDIGDCGLTEHGTIDSLPSLDIRAMSVSVELQIQQAERHQI